MRWVFQLAVLGLLAAPLGATADARLFEGFDPAGRRDGGAPGSFYGADTLPPGALAVGGQIGFPYVLVDFGAGVFEGMDARAGFRSLWGAMGVLAAEGRYGVRSAETGLPVALRLGLEYVFYQPGRAAMALTSTRDLAIHPGLVVSAKTGSGTHFYFDLGVQIALDLDPPGRPLGGATPPVEAYVNVPITLGTEVPLSNHVRVAGRVGMEVRVGPRDTLEAPVIPLLSIGLVLAG